MGIRVLQVHDLTVSPSINSKAESEMSQIYIKYTSPQTLSKKNRYSCYALLDKKQRRVKWREWCENVKLPRIRSCQYQSHLFSSLLKKKPRFLRSARNVFHSQLALFKNKNVIVFYIYFLTQEYLCHLSKEYTSDIKLKCNFILHNLGSGDQLI